MCERDTTKDISLKGGFVLLLLLDKLYSRQKKNNYW